MTTINMYYYLGGNGGHTEIVSLLNSRIYKHKKTIFGLWQLCIKNYIKVRDPKKLLGVRKGKIPRATPLKGPVKDNGNAFSYKQKHFSRVLN